jgi:hypothetical protein
MASMASGVTPPQRPDVFDIDQYEMSGIRHS